MFKKINYYLGLAKPSIKIQTENQLIEDPLQIAFNVFFKETVEKDPDNDPTVQYYN